MALSALVVKFSDLRKRSRPDACATAGPQEERKTMTLPQPRPRRRKPLDAGPFAPEIGSFRLHLAAEGKAAKTVRTYTEAVAWFAGGHLIPRTGHADGSRSAATMCSGGWCTCCLCTAMRTPAYHVSQAGLNIHMHIFLLQRPDKLAAFNFIADMQ